MWEYTDKVADHFKNPRNVGAVENPDGDGLAGSLACGDALRLTFKLDANKIICEHVIFSQFPSQMKLVVSNSLRLVPPFQHLVPLLIISLRSLIVGQAQRDRRISD